MVFLRFALSLWYATDSVVFVHNPHNITQMWSGLVTSRARYFLAALVLAALAGVAGFLTGAWVGNGFSQPVATFGAGALVVLGAVIAFAGQMIVNGTNRSMHVDKRELHLMTLRVDLYASLVADADLIAEASPDSNDRVVTSPIVRRTQEPIETVLERFQVGVARVRIIGGHAMWNAAHNFANQFPAVRYLHLPNSAMSQQDRASLFNALNDFRNDLVEHASRELDYTRVRRQ